MEIEASVSIQATKCIDAQGTASKAEESYKSKRGRNNAVRLKIEIECDHLSLNIKRIGIVIHSKAREMKLTKPDGDLNLANRNCSIRRTCQSNDN
jgi:hypothetical protein